MRSDYRARPSLAKPLLLGGGLLLLLALLWMLVSWLRSDRSDEPRRTVQQVTVLRPPPPPPPPKPEEKPPEPPKIKEEVKIDTPRPVDEPKAATEAPPPGPLGLDAQGSGPGDGFGLAGRPGGRDITVGGGSGGGGMGFTLFANGAARHIAQELARIDRLRNVEYRIDVRVWIARDGRIERFEILRGSGDAATDALIRDGMAQVTAIRSPVPDGLPQPLRFRVTSSDACARNVRRLHVS